MATTRKPLIARLREREILLRLVIITLCIPAMIVLGVAYPLTLDDFYYDGGSPAFNSFPYMGLCWALLWNLIFILLRFTLRKPHHPGIDVGFDLMGFLMAFGMGIGLIVWCAIANWGHDCEYLTGVGDYAEYCRDARLLSGLQYTGAILTTVVGLCHLTLMIWACRAVDALRKRKRDSFVELGEMDGAGKSGRDGA